MNTSERDKWNEIIKEFWSFMNDRLKEGSIDLISRAEMTTIEYFVDFLNRKGLVLCGKEQESK